MLQNDCFTHSTYCVIVERGLEAFVCDVEGEASHHQTWESDYGQQSSLWFFSSLRIMKTSEHANLPNTQLGQHNRGRFWLGEKNDTWWILISYKDYKVDSF